MGAFGYLALGVLCIVLVLSPIDLIPEAMISGGVAYLDDVGYVIFAVFSIIMAAIKVVFPTKHSREQFAGLMVKDFVDERKAKRDPLYDLNRELNRKKAEYEVLEMKSKIKGYEDKLNPVFIQPESKSKFISDQSRDFLEKGYGKDIKDEDFMKLFGFRINKKKKDSKKGGVKIGRKEKKFAKGKQKRKTIK